MPGTTRAGFDREALAEWYANRHFDFDSDVLEIYELPTDAPPREIRLLEVNGMISETTPLEPIDFGVDIGRPDAHVLFVLDITPGQWDLIQSGGLSLPTGWRLEGRRELARR